MFSCRDCNNTVKIDSDVESDDDCDESYEYGDSDAYDDQQYI